GDLSKPITLGLSSEAAEIGGIELRIAGPARQAALNWRRAGEHGFLPGRRLLVTLDPSGAPHTYQVHLAREEQWIGRIAALRIASTSGPARLLGVTLHKPRSALRPLDLRGVSLPSLVRDGRFEIPLTGDLPRPARLEVSLGILPEFQREGAKGCFSIATIGPGGDGARRPLYDQCIPSGGPEIAGWVPVRLDLDLPAEGRLVFDAHVEIGGTRLEAGALWGQPMLFARRAAPGKNLVLVVVDTLRTDALGAYGNRQGLTPNLDALARRSVRLAQPHALDPSQHGLADDRPATADARRRPPARRGGADRVRRRPAHPRRDPGEPGLLHLRDLQEHLLEPRIRPLPGLRPLRLARDDAGRSRREPGGQRGVPGRPRDRGAGADRRPPVLPLPPSLRSPQPL